MEDNWAANFGIATENPFDVESPAVDEFASVATRLVPELSTVERNKAKNTWRLFQSLQKGHARLPREIQIDPGGLAAASGSGLPADERIGFLRNVAKAAEKLGISKFSINVVDVKYVFRIRHWGNHHELIMGTLLEGSAMSRLPKRLAVPVDALELKTGLQVLGSESLVSVLSFAPQTSRTEIRSGVYDGDEIKVVCGIARVSDFWRAGTFEDMFVQLHQAWVNELAPAIIEDIVQPLRQRAVSEQPANQTE